MTTWGAPPILHAFLTIAKVDGAHLATIARFLKDVPAAQRSTPIVPLLGGEAWAADVLSAWAADKETKETVRKAIATASRKAGG
ncbi:MAG: hypothetical protein DI534_15020 [Leifsonia xyli]|nr:MAG: hypothetical protein DI534_15020 [Leifsonia xyli]